MRQASVGWAGVAATTALMLIGHPISAVASCAAPTTSLAETVTQAPVVFVAVAVATSNGDREAIMDIVSVWRGPELPSQVSIVGTPEPAAAATSVDRQYSVGHTYLVVPINQSTPFQDNQCTATQEYNQDLARLAPASIRSYPQPGPPAPGIPIAWWAGGGLLLLAAGAAAVAISRSRRTP